MFIVSLLAHPIPRYHQLLLLLDTAEMNETLAIICPRGEGFRRAASLRSLLSKQRLQMKVRGIPYEDFGIHAHVFPWTEGGRVNEAILFRRYRTIRHAVATIFPVRATLTQIGGR